MRWQIASPRPVPTPAALVVKNGSKIRASTCGGMPVPVSETSTTMRWLSPMRIESPIRFSAARPSGMACAALTMRFQEHLSDAGLVAMDRRDLGIVADDVGAVPDLVRGHPQRRFQHALDVDWPFLLVVRRAREHLEILDDVGHALRRLVRLAQRLSGLIQPRGGELAAGGGDLRLLGADRFEALQREFEVGHDHRE